ncbi:MAG: Rrf2 family transcriptional regulator [Proteobacteria bacterium]|jgi:Rrf2 family protein|nr:Rrf2 family transcriptional regulator [Pseudomonadota bacterium]
MTASRNILQFSEAANLGVHALVYLFAESKHHSAAAIAKVLNASPTHLSKVLGRLANAGFVTSTRGARGGFALVEGAAGRSVLDVIENLDGPLPQTACLLGRPMCYGGRCAFARLHDEMMVSMGNHLGSLTIAELARQQCSGAAGAD